MRYLLAAVFVFALVACGGSPAAVAPTAAPTPAPTKVPLAALDLEPLLIQSGDLPAGLTGAQVLDSVPPAYQQMQMPAAEKLIFQRLARGSDPGGYVVVSLYGDAAKRTDAYVKITTDMRTLGALTMPEDIGETAALHSDTLFGGHVAFQRCAAVVEVLLTGTDAQEVAAYAKRLDTRLRAAVC